MSGTQLEKEKDKRLLVLFVFGLLILLWDCSRYALNVLNRTGNVYSAVSVGCQTGKPGAVPENCSTSLSPRLAFFLNRPMAINQATREDLTLLPGIGRELAGRIVEFRDRSGFFENISDLEQVPGIGYKTCRKIGPLLTFTRP